MTGITGSTRLERRLQQLADDGLFNTADANAVEEQVMRDGQVTPTEQKILSGFYNDELIGGPTLNDPDERLVVEGAARDSVFELVADAPPIPGVRDPVKLDLVDELPLNQSNVYVPRTVEASLIANPGTGNDVIARIEVKPDGADVVPTDAIRFEGKTVTGEVSYDHYLGFAFDDAGGLQPGTPEYVEGTFFDAFSYGDGKNGGAAPVVFRKGVPSPYSPNDLTLEMFETAPVLLAKTDNPRFAVYGGSDGSLGYNFDGRWQGVFYAGLADSKTLDRDTKVTLSLDGIEFGVSLTAGMGVLEIEKAILDALPPGYGSASYFEGATVVRREIPSDPPAVG